MPAVLVVVALAGLLSADAPAGKIEWSRDFARAFQDAEERGRPVLIDFRGGSCGLRERGRSRHEQQEGEK